MAAIPKELLNPQNIFFFFLFTFHTHFQKHIFVEPIREGNIFFNTCNKSSWLTFHCIPRHRGLGEEYTTSVYSFGRVDGSHPGLGILLPERPEEKVARKVEQDRERA